ncbi:MAG: DUF2218 domain-containing protein [Sphingomonadaceae bacterium]
MTSTSRAVVPTRNASRYLQQLCKHWSHKFDVTFDPSQGRIALPSGIATMVAGNEALTVSLSLKPGGDMGRLQQVVANHLDRFAFREGELAFDWQPA